MIDHSAPSSSRRSNGKRGGTLLLIAVAVIVIAFGIWLAYFPSSYQVQGMADADSIHVSAKISARVRTLHVREGDRVRPGQLLFELDSPEVEARQRQVQAMLDVANLQQSKALEGERSEQIQIARANWDRATASNEIARTTLGRLQSLFQEGVVTRQRRDEAAAQTAGAEAAERAAKAQYEQALAGLRRQDRDAAGAQVRQAQGALAEVQASEVETRVSAPVGGEVEKRLAEVGELVPAGYPVLTLVDVDHLWVALNLREDQFSSLHLGQVIHGDIPALDMENVPFRIYYISPAGDYATWRATRQSRGYDIKSFEVRMRPTHPVANFRPGMSVLLGWPPR